MGNEEAWSLLKEMIDEVIQVHAKFGIRFFHMGADEVFQVIASFLFFSLS